MKRYDAVNTNGDPLYAPSPDGEMVFYSDVAALVAMNAELNTTLNEVSAMLTDIQDGFIMSEHEAEMLDVIYKAQEKAKELSHESSRG